MIAAHYLATSGRRLSPRAALETAREAAINLLDTLDLDPDAEDGGDDEPSLSAGIPALSWEGSQVRWLQGASDEREDCCEDEGAVTGDDEPELGE